MNRVKNEPSDKCPTLDSSPKLLTLTKEGTLTKESFHHLPTPLQAYLRANPGCSWASDTGVGINFLFCKCCFCRDRRPPPLAVPSLNTRRVLGFLLPSPAPPFPGALRRRGRLQSPFESAQDGEPERSGFESFQLPFQTCSKNLYKPFSKMGRPRLPSPRERSPPPSSVKGGVARARCEKERVYSKFQGGQRLERAVPHRHARLAVDRRPPRASARQQLLQAATAGRVAVAHSARGQRFPLLSSCPFPGAFPRGTEEASSLGIVAEELHSKRGRLPPTASKWQRGKGGCAASRGGFAELRKRASCACAALAQCSRRQ